jgi:23S rRNA (cytosine1962-C5)-methyltransferase
MRDGILRLKRGRDHPRTHPWIFKGDVADVAGAEPGGVVTVLDSRAQFVGRGHYNPHPALCCRIVTRVDEPVDAEFFQRRIEAARDRRPGAASSGWVGRLVWSEGDGLPGLVVDRYASVLVVQCATLGMRRAREDIVDALRAAGGDLAVFGWDDPLAARFEGFEPLRGWLGKEGPGRLVVDEGPVRFDVTFGAGHKTGLYLDQAENRRRLGPMGRDRTVLDLFAYTAGFACHALVGGARSAVCVESGAEAVRIARANLELNGVADRAEIRVVNAFDELRRLEHDRAQFGLIVLDPPPFARGRTALEAAARGYKEINLRAMRLLEPGGLLATFSCSHHVTDDFFEDVCRAAAADAGVTLRVLDRLTQSADHPVLLTVPETRYLKGLLLEAV